MQVMYFALYNVHFFAQIFEGKIRMRVIHWKYYFRIYINVFNSFIYAYELKV